nr:sulfatase [Candidatus Baldrarchaeota archaeon]
MKSGKNVLMILVDCLRADRAIAMSRSKNSFLHFLVKKGVLFTQAIATTSFTNPSVASIMTGLYPFNHGVRSFLDKLRKCYPTIADILLGAGYNTCAMVTGPLLPQLGFNRGFKTYMVRDTNQTIFTNFKEQIQKFLKNARKPWFLFLHLWELHYPVYFPINKRGIFVLNKYDTCLSFLDQELSVLLEDLDLNSTVVIFLSDHGERIPTLLESLQNNLISIVSERLRKEVWIKISESIFKKSELARKRQGHGFSLAEELIRIPLILAGGDLPENKVVKDLITHVDIFPTLLNLLGLKSRIKIHFDGVDLTPLIKEDKHFTDRFIYIGPAGIYVKKEDQIEGLRGQKWKYLERNNVPIALYDLKNDPQEQYNLLHLNKHVVRMLRKEMKNIKSITCSKALTSYEKGKIRYLRKFLAPKPDKT